MYIQNIYTKTSISCNQFNESVNISLSKTINVIHFAFANKSILSSEITICCSLSNCGG